nr:hypothetical protein [Tanacetum cinerariifolium]
MDVPVIFILAYSSEERDGDTIKMSVDGDRADVVKVERSTLHTRIISLETVKMRLRNTLRDEREARARIEHHLGLVQEELRQSRMSRRHDQESFKKLKDFMISHHKYRP